jgi:pimeloyl-ACP methyl ester carboxylesterase
VHDRRGFGRSAQPWGGYDYDTFADDLATLFQTLDLKDVALFGFSMGGGEVARYIGRHGTARLSKAGLVSAVPPLMLQTPDNPAGTPLAAFDGIRTAIRAERSQFFQEVCHAFFGANREGAKVSQGTLDRFWLMAMQASIKRHARLRQGLLRDELYRGSEEVRCADARHPRRQRPDRADRRCRARLGEDCKERNLEGLSRCATRSDHHLKGRSERRHAGLSQSLCLSSVRAGADLLRRRAPIQDGRRYARFKRRSR